MPEELWPKTCDCCRRKTLALGDAFCSACWDPWAKLSPLVQFAREPQEVEALLRRYEGAVDELQRRSCQHVAEQFEESVSAGSQAVISMPVAFFQDLKADKRTLYATYSLLVDIGARKPARPQDDANRRLVDTTLWGQSGQYVRTAALSLDGSGVSSYGEVWVTLDDICVAYRSIVLEENSFDFVERHGLGSERIKTRPYGYLATWIDRGKLAIAKCGLDLKADTKENDFIGILLFTEGQRNTDRFLEVHIYGGFNWDAIIAYKFDEKKLNASWGDKKKQEIEMIVVEAARSQADRS